MMPGMDGFEACQRLREMTDTPILILTGRWTSPDDIVRGLDMGADEYMTKPFNNLELISRLKVCLRRGSNGAARDTKYLFPAPSVVVDCGKHELIIEGETIHLSPNEFEVIQVLARHAGHTFSAEAILLQAWGAQHIGDTHLIKQYIYQLRQKIEPDPSSPRYLHTVRGAGYYFATHELD
jgi:DNA-binding response OmpR family regulator